MCNKIDWSVATIEERRLFKRVMMKAVNRHSLNIDKILAEYIGEDTSLENEQKKRFGRGTLARTSYAILHEWLSLKYPDFAKDFEFEFYQNKPKNCYRQLISFWDGMGMESQLKFCIVQALNLTSYQYHFLIIQKVHFYSKFRKLTSSIIYYLFMNILN